MLSSHEPAELLAQLTWLVQDMRQAASLLKLAGVAAALLTYCLEKLAVAGQHLAEAEQRLRQRVLVRIYRKLQAV